MRFSPCKTLVALHLFGAVALFAAPARAQNVSDPNALPAPPYADPGQPAQPVDPNAQPYQPPPVYQPPPQPVYQPPMTQPYQPQPYQPQPYRAMAPRFRPQFGLGLRGMGSWNENQFGSFSQGGIGGELLFRVHPRLNLELAAQYQRSSDQTEAYLGYARWDAPLTLGLRIHLGNAYWPISPYLVVAGGMDRAQATVLATDGLVYDRSWMFEGQGGGGVELRLGRHLAMNFDIRGVGRVRADGQRSLQVFDGNNIGYDILGNQFSLQFNFGLAAYF